MFESNQSSLPSAQSAGTSPASLRAIIFAKFLTQPLSSYQRFVMQVESSPSFAKLAPCIRISLLHPNLITDVADATEYSHVLGEIPWRVPVPAFFYCRTAFARHYDIDEAAIKELAPSHEVALTLHHLHLINSRNKLTNALIQTLLIIQSEYLKSGNPLDLVAFPQAAMSRLLREDGDLTMVPDAGRLSRLIKGLSFRFVGGAPIPLGFLFPSERQLHRQHLDALICEEKKLLLEGQIARPWSDQVLAETLAMLYGKPLTRRSVSEIRRQLGHPDCRHRKACREYLIVTRGFSALKPIRAATLPTHIPCSPGVYEIRTRLRTNSRCIYDKNAIADTGNVIYIGSSNDLRKRITDHLRGNSDNPLLAKFLVHGETLVRFRVVDTEWRQVERDLYRAFCRSFGGPPPCNRMSP